MMENNQGQQQGHQAASDGAWMDKRDAAATAAFSKNQSELAQRLLH